MKVYAFVPGAGVGARMGAEHPKQYLSLQHQTVAEHTLERLLSHPGIEQVVVGISADDPYWPKLPVAKQVKTVVGGATRAETVLNGLCYLREISTPKDWVLVHDMARPCLHHSDIDALLRNSCPQGALLGVPVADTLKKVDQQTVHSTIEREQIWRAFTPQFFSIESLHHALTMALAAGHRITDEASAMEFMRYQPAMVHGRSDNIKITWPEDLTLAAFYLQQQTQEHS